MDRSNSIDTESDYKKAMSESYRLSSAEIGTPEHERFRFLCLLLHNYEEKILPFDSNVDAKDVKWIREVGLFSSKVSI